MAKAAASTGRTRTTPYDLESLLVVVVDEFNVRGYDGTSMENLSARLGISKSAIYHHVVGKEQLLKIALDRALDGLDTIAKDAQALGKPAIDQLEYLIRGSVKVLQEEHSFVALLLRVRASTPTGKAALNRRRDIDNLVADLVEQAQKDGDMRPDLDPTITARLLFGMVNSLAEWYRPTGTPDDKVANAICQMAFDGLRPRSR